MPLKNDDECTVFEMVQHHDQDLYRGNGKPGLTTRMAVVETRTEENSEQIKLIDKRMWLIILGVAATFLTVLGDIVVRTVK